MKAIPDGCVDAVITDPPYGINWDGKVVSGPSSTGKRGQTGHYGIKIAGDDTPFNPEPLLRFGKVLLWGFHHYPGRLTAGSVLVWLKRYDDGFGSFLSDADLAWLNTGCGVYCRRDVSLQGDAAKGARLHPTQKPVGIMEWCIEKAGDCETILDPFLGSGTTAVAAKKLGRHFLGFEISEEYCRIARERIALVEAQPTLFESKPEQLGLEAE